MVIYMSAAAYSNGIILEAAIAPTRSDDEELPKQNHGRFSPPEGALPDGNASSPRVAEGFW
ncbi:hypothetical protein HPT29_013705 [Microvirga terrae]|uniref:Uncharacterized protein n=1 Tax=Microvirga terrae TaxID=2740529 RepID=A0ABY5RK68_9HYPH|nr:hypothetical protein [Microvirga terrae]UVF17600.1 hypothetical protein HPT29_013705 [Microvirga terrae]